MNDVSTILGQDGLRSPIVQKTVFEPEMWCASEVARVVSTLDHVHCRKAKDAYRVFIQCCIDITEIHC